MRCEALSIVLCFVVVTSIGYAEETRDIPLTAQTSEGSGVTKSFSLESPQTFRVVNPYGNVHVRFRPNPTLGASSANQVSVHLTGEDPARFNIIVTEHVGQGVEIRILNRGGWVPTDMEIYLPPRLVQNARVVSVVGNVQLSGSPDHSFDPASMHYVQARTRRGSIDVRNLQSVSLSQETESGGIHYSNIGSSRVEAHSGSGDVSFTNVGQSMVVATTTGRVSLRLHARDSLFYLPGHRERVLTGMLSESPTDLPMIYYTATAASCEALLSNADTAPSDLFRFGLGGSGGVHF